MKGMLQGGKLATPIREMLNSKRYDGVVFHCDDPQHAEAIRISVLILRNRNGYSYKTRRRDNDLYVYKGNPDYYYPTESNTFGVVVHAERKEDI